MVSRLLGGGFGVTRCGSLLTARPAFPFSKYAIAKTGCICVNVVRHHSRIPSIHPILCHTCFLITSGLAAKAIMRHSWYLTAGRPHMTLGIWLSFGRDEQSNGHANATRTVI
jgi:hypothetical protein